ncbi:amino acid adenylation domain-containing protein [Nostoc linckia NIES-25]|nr:amino acid adenylation domain-containing protein [Nostoc linckia NIES-25]
MNSIVKTNHSLSYGQEAMWFIYQIAPKSVAYNIFITAKVNFYLNITTVNCVWKKIIEKHSILRTTYTNYEGKSVQQVNQKPYFSVELIDASEWSEDQLKENIFVIADRPFNLEKDSVLKVNLFTRSATEYILLLTMHHIAGDMWSFDLLLSEFQALYAKEIEQASLEQTEVTDSLSNNKSYADFVRWQSEMLSSSKGEKLWQYWQQKLAGELPILNLLPDKPRPPVQTYRGASHIIKLDEQLTQKLKHLALTSGTSLYRILLAAFYVQLYRYTNQTDILIGSPMRGRWDGDFREIVGYCVNLTVLRVSVNENATFNEFLAQVSKTVREAQDHQDYPFSLLAEQLQPQRDLSRSPLCQVSFTWQRQRWCEPKENLLHSETQVLQMEPYLLGHQRGADLDLNLMVMEAQEVLQLCWQYNTDLFDSSTIERMTGHFVTLLEGIVTNPTQPIFQLPLLTQVEQQQLLVQWNSSTQADYPKDKCIHQLFEEQVHRTPNAVAVVFGDEQLTYDELNCRANQLANYLQTLGVKSDTLVGICVERSIEMVVGLLGILKAGGAYVPLDPEYPSDRLSFMLEDAQVAVLLTQQRLLEKLPQHQAQVVCLDTDWQSISASSQENSITSVQADNLAYVIYTSGSTGRPKGVLIQHGAIANHCCIIQQTYALEKSDRVLQFASINFDASIEQIFPTLMVGATLVLRGSDVWTPANFQKVILDFGLTVINLPTAYWQQVTQEWAKSQVLDINRHLRLVVVGGDVILPEYVNFWQQSSMSGVRLINAYGPTETTITATLFEIPPQLSQGNNLYKIPIGRPLPNRTVYILDKRLQPVPIGVPGELYIGGECLAKGYLNLPELTQEKFILSPFDNSKLYKTGDLVRYLADGTIEYLGRIDNQVKIRGFRIELGEIETALSQYPHVQANCVIAREDVPGNKTLVAYIVAQKEQTCTERPVLSGAEGSRGTPKVNELRSFLKEKLPEYMVPNAIVFLEALPLTPNGKIDRRALPVPDLDSILLEKYVAPRTPTEELLAQIWAQVLKVEQVGIYDNFFELGGHSLLATQLVSRIRNIFKVELPLRELFAAATVAELAQFIGQLQQQNSELSAPPILPKAENAQLVLSYAQQRLWFLDQFEPDSPFYNMPEALRLEGTLAVAALEQSLQDIIARHEALRTNFITIDGTPTQVIQSRTNWKLSVVDFKHLSTSEREIAAQQLLQQQATQPFDLATESLVRATLIVLSEAEHILLICMHHIVSDGWSMGVFIAELAALYNAYAQGQESPLAPLPIQYADFALWQRQWLQGEVLQSQLNYWQQKLADAPTFLSLPTDRPRSAVQTYNGTHQEFALSLELTDKLTKLGQEQGVTLFMTLLAAFDTLLYRYTGTEDILVGSPIANRDRQEIEGLIGFFVNTLVMRSDLAGNPTFSELLTRVREMAMEAYSHQNLPFEMLVEALQPERDLSHTPLFQVMFVLQNAPTSGLDLTGLNVNSFLIKGTTSRFDLTLIMQNTPTGLRGLWEYNTDLFDFTTIDRMTSHLVNLLEGVTANPEQHISQLPLLSEVEQQQLLVEWNDTRVDYPLHKCIHQLFEEQVELTPDGVAVVFGNQQLTYSQLNYRANQLAHHLRSVGVGADVLVGLCVERSTEMVIGLLGILKAGGAYVPLDPNYPQERLRFIVEDTQVAVLVTQQSLIDNLPQHQARVICLDTEAEVISQCSQNNLISGVQSHHLTYIIYTSGSTGQPKGIAMSQLALCNHILWHRDNLKITRGAKTLQFASVSFDVSFQEIFTTWCSGGTLFLITEELRRDALALLGFLEEKQIQRMFLPVVGLQQLAEVALGNDIVNTGLREIITSGEQLQITPAISLWLSQLTDITLHNQYGPSESHLATSYTLPNAIDTWPLLPSIGRPISNTQIYILDKYLQPVPVGVQGEVYIAGALLAQGYFNRPELTQEKFISNPFEKAEGRRQEAGGKRLYKTGDLARYLPDGKLESLGRIDNQVKIRGFRIELGEVEAVLGQLSDVQASCAIVREDTPGDKRLVAYIVPQPEQTCTERSRSTISIGEVRNFLKEKLPEYMVPSAIVILDALPLSANRKLDRRALPAPDLHSQLLDRYVAPRNPIEEILAVIWAQVLKVELVGIYDNFFELGGHSLLATQLVSRVRSSLKVELPLRSLFAAPTVAELSQHIQQLQQQEEITAPAILPRAENTDLPLSFAQQRLWFLDQLNPNSAFYNLPIVLRLVGTLNREALEQSLQEIINRHEALRTNFVLVDGNPTQVIQPEINCQLSVVDLRHLSTSEIEIAAQQFVQQQAFQAFDLETQALVRPILVILNQTEHILLASMHHIVSDGWSMTVFVSELASLYNAYAQGQPSPLTPLPIQYADFAIWQRQWLQGDVLQNQLNYWQKQLADAPTLLALPTDRPRPAVQTFAGAYQQFKLSVELTDKLSKLSQEQGVTLFMTLLAAYDTLLYRYTGQADILVGSPIANRDRSEIEGLIGFFVNTLVMRTDLSGNPSFNELLGRVREVALGAYAHQNLPFEMLVEALQPERNLSHTPIFQVMFVLQNTPISTAQLTGLTVSQLLIESATAKFDLTLGMEQTATGLVGVFEYNTDLFDAATIERLTGHFVTLLEAIVTNPQERIAQLPILTAVEQQQLIDWNDTTVDYPTDKCIHQLFEEQVARTPDAVAVVYENQQLTYSQLNSRANQLAHYLKSLGVEADTLVGICVERCLDMVVGQLGILKAGGAYLPLDSEYPSDRLSFMLGDAQVPVLLTQQQLIDKLSTHPAKQVLLDTDAAVISQYSSENLITTTTAKNLAYVIYTSGSTGKPKGVLVAHEALLNLVFWHQRTFEITPSDKATQVASTAFDAAVWELWPYLVAGASIYLIKPGILGSGVDLQDWLLSHNITISFLPTPVAEQLLSLEWKQNTALRTLLTGGDKLNRYPSKLLPFQVVNNYGPTENTVVTTSGVVVADGGENKIAPPIGRPIANAQVYILDEYLQPVPIGVPGELHIGGASLARGYLNRSELTQEKFIAHPFDNKAHSRLYKTGDLVRYLADGNIEYLGRIDNQVKIRGFRIELGEIEAVLNQNADVQASCVILREDIPAEKRLVAYVAPYQHSKLTVNQLHQELKAKLPAYMMPQAFVILEEMPLTANGKVDRRALPAPDLQSDKDKYVAPRTPIEELLAQIWAQVLKVELVGIHENFFELGGHSLLATQLISRIRSHFQVELPLRELFAGGTVAELAQLIEQLQQQKLQLTAPPILPRPRDVQLPLSFAQTRLWFLDQFDPNSAFYNIPAALRLAGTLNREALERSLQEIIARHEALRTNFITIDGEPIQVIRRQGTGDREQGIVSVVNLQYLSLSEREIAVQKLVQQQATQPFDLVSQALIRVTLVVLSETEHIFLMCMHHIVSDGWSMGVFVSELAALYNAYSQGKESFLTPLPIQYGDFAIWQRQWLQGEVLQTQLNYWEQQLKDAPALLMLPTDRPRAAQQTFAGATQEFALSMELTQKLTQLSQEQGVTLFMTLLAAFDTLLYRYTEQEDILVGTPIANRNRGEIEGLIGFFVNTLVLRTDLSGNPSFNQLLGRVRQMAMEAYSHQDLPFEMLVERLQPERDLSHAPLFQVDFLLQNDPLSQVELTGLSATALPIESTTAKFDLTLAMSNTATGLVGVFEYNTDLFDSSTIERMVGHFVTLVSAIVANPQQHIAQLPMLTEVEQRQILGEWNDTQADYPAHQCVHQLFESQVELTPDAVAVVFGNEQLTYQQLNTQANQLAHYLQSLGVGTETFVGIYLERSLSIIVALLAVLKAGGAYVPLDPDYPQQRLADISQDSQFSVLISETKLLDSLPVEGVRVIVLDAESQTLAVQSQENPTSNVTPENLTCILYTSGSTGKPKGVMLSHAALVSHSCAISKVFGLTSGDRVLQFASFSFDVAAEEIFPTWYTGGTVVLRPAQMFPDLASFAQFIEQERLSVLNITPAYWHEWAVAVSQQDATVPESLRLVAVGGDTVLPGTVAIWRQLVGDRVSCINVYGPTEASVTAIVHDLLDPKLETTNTVLIGRPIANTQAYILDRYLQPVPVGVKGELHLGGVRLARGYLNRIELTQEKFLANPFMQEGNRLYKTGDLARYLPDGSIECFGRIDNQVKIRGFRIELGEIETVLNQHPDVQISCVIVREDAPGSKRLVAYIVPFEQKQPSISELRQFLSSKLPLYMVPQAFVTLEALPLTPNRKVDRRALPAPDLYSDRLDRYVAPRTSVEEMLSQIWVQVLKVGQIGIHDNFFEIGGHSLLATQLVSRIRNTFKIELPLRSLFAAPTVAQLAQVIGLQQQNSELAVPLIVPRSRDAELPLSYAQQRLWFLDQFQPNSPIYNIPLALRLAGTLNRVALEQSLEEIIHRHEALRTNFITVAGKPSQIVQTQRNWTISVVDLQHLPISEQETATQQLAQQQATQAFDLASTSLIRAELILLSETEHILLVSMHHIVSDDWSMNLFVQELTVLYNTYSQGESSPLAPLPIQYADFAIWQRQWLQGDLLQSQLSYWEQQLADAPALLVLPTDRPRPAVQTFAGASLEFELSLDLTGKLTQLSQEQGCTLFMALLAAYDTLLYRYTGVADILVGSPIANRNRNEIEGLIGFFVNTLVMRTDLSGNPSFSELLGRVREVALGAYSHQDLPFEMLVEALQPQRNLSHSPLFQVAFVFQNAPTSELEMTGLTVSLLTTEIVASKFDLTLAIANTPTGLVGAWEYNTNLFDRSTIERLTGHFVTLLEAIVTNPQERIAQLHLLTAVEQQQLIEFNDTTVDYPTDKCIHQLFEEQVARTPDAVAVVYENQQLTYSQLNSRANQLAHYLKSLGVEADTLVGICVERCLDMVVGQLAILKAGGAYVPLDSEYPSDRLSFMLEDAQVPVLLTQQPLVDKLSTHPAKQVLLDTDAAIISQYSSENPVTATKAKNLAYVIYTSGSTGQPKGVLVAHEALLNLVFWHQRTFKITASDKATQLASTAFDAAVWELWPYLVAGASIYLIKPGILGSGVDLQDWLLSENITISFLPTPVAEQLLSLEWKQNTALRTVLTGGDKLNRYPSNLLPFQVVNNYGPTENTVVTTSGVVVADGQQKNIAPPIGRPIANAQVYILDEYLQPVPIGVPGELHIGGASLARGYLNRNELTQQKFIAHPFEAVQGSRLYKTGDLVRYLADGNIEYLGRIDNQVKVRGFRIELGEIEAVLNQNADVQTSCVILREDIPGEKRLVAYVVPYSQQIPTTSELRQYLSNHLPLYMMPQALVILESLPLTANGKIDRRALPKPELDTTAEFVAPRTPVEETLAQIWAQVLKIEQVGIHDNFFELGGHSLLATQIISRVQSAFSISLPLRYLFESPTIAQLSEAIFAQLQTGSALTVPPIVPVSRNADIPLSWAQERLWFVNQLEGESGAYTIDFTVRLVGNLNVTALEQAFDKIVQRHEPLRTRFEMKDNKPAQVIEPNMTITLPAIALQHESNPTKKVEDLATQEACKPFDLAHGPVLRIKLWQIAPDEHVLLFAIHHIAADGWSMGVLINELSACYKAISTGSTAQLPELPVQYADFAVWQRQWLTNEVLERQLTYWKQHLTGAPPLLELPTDRPRPAIQTFRGGTEQLQIDSQLTQQLKKLTQESGSTLFMTLLAGFVVLMSRYSGQTDLVIGSPIANRNRTEIEGLIGFFVNSLALRFDLSGEPTFESLLRQVREVTQNAYDNQDLPFEMLVEELQVERNLDRNPLAQVVFALQNAPSSPWDLPGVNVEGMASGLDSVRLDLEVYLWDAPEGLVGFCSYNRDLFDAATISRMMQHFVTLLAAIVDEPQQPVALLPLLTQQERHQLLVEWNDTQADYPQDKCIHQLFESQVARTPDAVAVVFENQQLTYHELNSRANQLAHYLQSLGVGADVLVGLCVERSPLMLIGLLAILKAGGAYVPLDSEYPSDRLGYMLEDTQVPVLLTQRHLIEKLPPTLANLVFINEIWSQIDENNRDNLTSGVKASHLANVIYTSGSTGKPKGVMVEHRGLYNLALAQIQAFGVDSSSRVLQFASFSFDACISEILMTLGSGATLYLGTKDSIMPGMPLLERLRNYGITHITLPPSALAVMPTEALPSLQAIVVAGEACSPELIKQWSTGRNFFNGYGPTEASVCATIAKCNHQDEKVTIGRPIANAQVYILDKHLQPVPVGVPGELHIGGVGLARGYLNRPELTQEKFISNPFQESRGAKEKLLQSFPSAPHPLCPSAAFDRLYKTGDLARYLPDGNIEYLGRIDNQVKIRGYRIELGEIEAVISQLPEVQEAVVIARENQNKKLESPINLEISTGKIELWPSIAEYYVYDELLYYAMTNDHRRNDSYQVAINQLVKDKIVVEIGTGKDAILSRFCVAGGAKKVYAIELNEETSRKARACIEKLGLADRITIIHGDATKVDIPELADVCVSEIVGAIGGSEGAAVIINNARRFLKPGGLMIPERSMTKMAAVTLPDEILHNLKFAATPAHYTRKIFEEVGYPFDLRVCIKKFPQVNVISTVDVLEDLNFNEYISPELSHKIELKIQKNGRMDGFLVWLNLHTIAGQQIDILENEYCWIPVYFPVFEPGIEVEEGDIIRAVCTRTLCENNLNPDYAVKGCLLKKNGEKIDFEYISYHYKNNFQQTPFYQRLFADYDIASRNVKSEDKRLVAYLVPALDRQILPQQLAQWQSEYVSDWQMLYEKAYGQPQTAADDLTFNISGWNSSYTKEAIPDWEMREWVENTVSRILSVSPQRVLEIGCGTGLLLSRIAPKSQEYWGIDYSSAALQHIEQMCKILPLNNVHLRQRTADNFDGIPQAEFDTVVINSVVQYFPSVDYLLQVIAGAIAAIGDRGKLFVGDVRSLPLLEPYHAAVQFFQATEEITIEQWQQKVNQSVAAEEELLIDPGFFIALKQRFPQITWVEIQPKRGYAENELTQFRYDVTLHIGADVQTPVLSELVLSEVEVAEVTVVPWLNWQLDRLSFSQIQNQLQQQPEVLGIRGVPNQRVQQAIQIWQWWENPPVVETVEQLRQLLAKQPTEGINPEEFYQLGQQLGYTVHLSWWCSSQDGAYDVVFCRKQEQRVAFWDNISNTAKSWTDYTNNPLYGKLVQKLVPQVRSFIEQKLPNYMVPQAFVLLNALPLTPNGKVDRRALPAPDTAVRNLGTNFVSPRTPIEAQLVQIWSEVLGSDRIGIHDNFFELGGHSLLATQVISRLRNTFSVELSLQNFLEYPTVANLAQIIEVVGLVQDGQPSITNTQEDYEEGEL